MIEVTAPIDVDISPEELQCLQSLSGFRSLHIFRTLSSGHSGARVFLGLTDRNSTRVHSTVVVKLESITHIGSNEATKHVRAAARPMMKHMPKLIASGRYRQLRAYVYDLVGEVLNPPQSLDRFVQESPQAPALVTHIAKLLLRWSSDHTLDTVRPVEILRRSTMEHHIPQVLEAGESLALDKRHPVLWFTGDDELVPNPVAYLVNPDLWSQGNQRIVTACGPTHGDLHGGNVLIVQNRIGTHKAYLIDFGQYDPGGNRFFDIAYLELSLLVSTASPCETAESRATWLSLCKLLGKRDHTGSSVRRTQGSVLASVQCLTREVYRDAFRRGETESSLVSYHLAAVAASMHYFRRPVPEIMRKAVLLYGAYHLKTALASLGLMFARSAEPIEPVSWFTTSPR